MMTVFSSSISFHRRRISRRLWISSVHQLASSSASRSADPRGFVAPVLARARLGEPFRAESCTGEMASSSGTVGGSRTGWWRRAVVELARCCRRRGLEAMLIECGNGPSSEGWSAVVTGDAVLPSSINGICFCFKASCEAGMRKGKTHASEPCLGIARSASPIIMSTGTNRRLFCEITETYYFTETDDEFIS